jgi:hypothetical protein
MRRLAQFRAAYRRTTTCFAALLLACLALGAGLSLAQGDAPKNFDHLKTGYALTGMHVQARCESCHLNGIFKGTPRDCVSCHAPGMRAARGNVVMPPNHVPYKAVPAATMAQCDTCHKGSVATWTHARFHQNVSVSTGCATCHTLGAGGIYLNAVGRPATAVHATVTGQCETCHKSTIGWSAVNFAHSPANAVGTGTCDACHNGGTAKGRPATHIPAIAVTARCDACHRSQVSFATAMTMNHTAVATQRCTHCHNGAFTSQGTQGALAQPMNHIPVVQLLSGAALDCNACHTNTAAWTSLTMNHNNSLGNGAGTCRACHATGTSFLGNMQKNLVTHRSATATDCSLSGCHRPQGSVGMTYRKWD